jgi:DNA-binding response OmpR family regulator
VRGADTDRPDLSPQAPGLLALSLGLARRCLDDDQRMLSHGFVIDDALYEWLRYAKTARHGWDPARVAAAGEPAWDTFESGRPVIRLGARGALVDHVALDLGPEEFALLVALVARAGRVLSRGCLLQHVWAYEPDVASRTVDWHVAELRKRLGALARTIVTVRGGGYRWDAEHSATTN